MMIKEEMPSITKNAKKLIPLEISQKTQLFSGTAFATRFVAAA